MALACGAWACSDAQPCNTCPALGGAYLVSWQTGTPSAATCPAIGPRPSNLNITQVGSTARTLVGGVELAGTVYDTWDFVLNSPATEVWYSLQGRAVATQGASDAGVRVLGTLTTRTTGAKGSDCELPEKFTADKI